MNRPDWDEYFLQIADAVSGRADCVRRRVGAVVVKDRRIRATGYNGAPAGRPGCVACPRRTSNVAPGSDYRSGPGMCVAVHAERNAIDYCDEEDLEGSTLYITTDPCQWCQELITEKRISRVVWPEGELNFAGA